MMKVDLEKFANWLLRVLVIASVLCVIYLLMISCSAPKAVQQQHHHQSVADTMAVQAVVDSRLQEVREQMESDLRAVITSQLTQQTQTEQEKERVTETITTWVDSLGRAFRQEQRSTERDISRQQELREERMQQEYEQRLLQALDSMNASWQEKLEAVQSHNEQEDSTALTETPVPGDNRPWYKRWWDAMMWMLVGAVVLAIGWIAFKVWRMFSPFKVEL